MTGTRPNVLQWFRYAFGGGLPTHLSGWVLHDTTCRTWLARHIVRFLVQLTPIAVLILVFLPAPIGLRVGCVVVGVAAAVVFSFGYIVEMAEHRVMRAGYPDGTATRLRDKRTQDAQRKGAARRREKSAQRRARR